MADPVQATISTIYHGDSDHLLANALPQRVLSMKPSSKDIDDYLEALTTQANRVAEELSCGSILAGHSSEADEFGDVAFWIGLGEYGPGKEADVLEALGLSASWIRGQIEPLELSSSTILPTNIPSHGDESLLEKLKKLSDPHAFTVKQETGEFDGTVLYVLVGRLNDKGWAGLVGIGILLD